MYITSLYVFVEPLDLYNMLLLLNNNNLNKLQTLLIR